MNKWIPNVLPVFLSGIMLLLPVYSIAQSQVIDVSEIEDMLPVRQTMVYVDSTNNLKIGAIADMYKNKGFKVVSEYGTTISSGNFNTWVHFKLSNPSDKAREVVFVIPGPRIDSFEVFSVSAFHEVKYWGKCYGIGFPVSQKPLKSLSHAIAYNLEPHAAEDIYINIRRFPYSILNKIHIYEEGAFLTFENIKYSKLSFIYGLYFLEVIICLTFYIALFRKYLLLFILTITVKVWFVSYIFGIFSFYELDFVSTSGIIFLIIIIQYWYFKLFFDLSYSRWFIASLFLFFGLHCAFYPFFKDKNFDYSLITGVSTLIITGVFLYEMIMIIKKGYGSAILFLISQLPIICSILLSAFNNFKNLYHLNLSDILFYNTVTELFIFAIVLVERLWRLNKDRLYYFNKISILHTEVIKTQESERQKIAADLHDDLGSTLAVLKDKIESGSKDALPVVKKAMNDLRSISHQLMPHEFDLLGFKESLERFVDESNRQAGMHISLVFYGVTTHLPADKELNVYRILTELIHNSRKHSKASGLAIELTCRPDCLYVSFAELDGESLPAAAQPGIGLRSITSRLEYLNATVLENSFTSAGYNLTFEIGV